MGKIEVMAEQIRDMEALLDALRFMLKQERALSTRYRLALKQYADAKRWERRDLGWDGDCWIWDTDHEEVPGWFLARAALHPEDEVTIINRSTPQYPAMVAHLGKEYVLSAHPRDMPHLVRDLQIIVETLDEPTESDGS